MRSGYRVIVAIGLSVLGATSALAQSVPATLAQSRPAIPANPAPSPRFLIDVGGLWMGGGRFGSTDANYTAPDGSTFTLFSTSNSISAGLGLNSHLHIRIKPRVYAEIAGSWSRPELRSKTSGDFEGVEPITATETISQFTLGGGAVLRLKAHGSHGKWEPFLRGHVAWLRQLAGDNSLYQDGLAYDAGGGVFYRWKDRDGHFRPYGLRVDAWLAIRRGGMELAKGKTLLSPAFSLALIVKP